MAMNAKAGNKGVTLLELLIAIAVIAVLAALVMAGLRSLSKASALTGCMNNLKQIYVATRLYMNDHNERFPSIRWDLPSTYPGTPGVANYLSLPTANIYQDTVMSCPAVQKGDRPSRRPFHMNYSINSAATFAYSTAVSLEKPVRIQRPGHMLLYTEGAVNPTLLGAGLMKEPYNYYTHVNWGLLHALTFPHRGRQHVIFLDGHLELLSREEFTSQQVDPLWSGLDQPPAP